MLIEHTLQSRQDLFKFAQSTYILPAASHHILQYLLTVIMIMQRSAAAFCLRLWFALLGQVSWGFQAGSNFCGASILDRTGASLKRTMLQGSWSRIFEQSCSASISVSSISISNSGPDRSFCVTIPFQQLYCSQPWVPRDVWDLLFGLAVSWTKA